jgi:hypothetical protein
MIRVDHIDVGDEEQVVGERERPAAGAVAPVHHREEDVEVERPAEEHRGGHLLRQFVLREELPERDRCRTVDDEADVAPATHRPGEEDCPAIELAELGAGDEQGRLGDVRRARGA